MHSTGTLPLLLPLDAQCVYTLKVCSNDVAVAATKATFSCRNNWIPLYLMELFRLCGNGDRGDNDTASKWVQTVFCVVAAMATCIYTIFCCIV